MTLAGSGYHGVAECDEEDAAVAVRTFRADSNPLRFLRLQITTTTDTNIGGLDSTNNIRLRQCLQGFAKAAR